LVLAVGALASCVIDPGPPPYGTTHTAPDRSITCGHFANFQVDCTANCSSNWDCEANYNSLDVNTQITLDDCSDCLAANVAGGSCGDCSDPYVGSCRQFMEDLLGVNCW
jgi:hypothetical protein